MASSIKTIFLQESEKDIFHSLRRQGIDTDILESRLEELFKRVYNNEVGYYIFRQNDQIYKLVILPKTIDATCKMAEKEFVNYLLHYYRINNIYQYDKTKYISKSLLSLAFETNNGEEPSSHKPIEKFEFYKYMTILEHIESFFKKHKNYKRTKIEYISQSVKHKLNLSKNIKELDKSKIHQTKTIDRMYSEMATIAYHALKLFSLHKINHLDEKSREKIYSKIRQLNTVLSKKYHPDKAYKLTLTKLSGFKVSKHFNANGERKQLLTDIRSLFGFQQMYNDNKVSVENRYDLTTTSFFIDPILFYEWYVYDILKDFADHNNYKILFDKDKHQANKTTIPYDLISKEFKKDKERKSNPDYILIDEGKKIKIVLDAKWKNIKKLGDIKSSDFLKLKHDAQLLEKNNYKAIPYLVYPNYLSDEDKISIPKDDIHYFSFGVLQIDMNFEKEKNTINFKYDFEKIEEKFLQEKVENEIQAISENYTNEIKTKRSETIVNLLNSESLDEKEEIFNELDNTLLESLEKINEKINEKISPEVQKILDDFEEILAPDSKKFLKSSSSIYNYYRDKNYKHFDYSMPGSGLWKLIELELNTSFSWFLRIKSNVCNNLSPWTNISTPRRSITQDLANGKRVKLNQYEYSDNTKLQGLMLGGISLLLQDNDTISEFDAITDLNRTFFPTELIDFLSKIINLRNEHAHIKAMSLDRFEELYNLLFQNDINSNIFKLLEFKKTINQAISS